MRLEVDRCIFSRVFLTAGLCLEVSSSLLVHFEDVTSSVMMMTLLLHDDVVVPDCDIMLKNKLLLHDDKVMMVMM